jgi:hypothetical protein
MGAPLVPLDRRIADCLAATEHETDDLAALVKETIETLGACDAEAVHAGRIALDPTIVDLDAKGRADHASFRAARLRNALARLNELHSAAVARDKLAAWDAELAKLVTVRDELAARFRTRYCEMVEGLIGIFDEMAVVDQQIDDLNGKASTIGERRRVRMTECVARGIDGFSAGTKSILEEVKLPGFGLGSGEVKVVWPRPKPNFGSQIAAAMAPLFRGPQMDPALVAEANAEVEASGGNVFFGEAYRRATERRSQAQAEKWAEEGRERERQRETAAAEEAQRHRDAAVERRRLGM